MREWYFSHTGEGVKQLAMARMFEAEKRAKETH